MAALFNRAAVIGLGLIGSSLARAIRQKGLAAEITGADNDPAVAARARELGLADSINDTATAVRDADLVMLCVPLGAYRETARAMGPSLKPGAIVSDVGSCKACVPDMLGPYLPAGVTLVPGHPVAGTENSGPDAGFATLFAGRYCILTPEAGCPPEDRDRVATLWRAIGATVEIMEASHHDRVFAITSHLPHLIAYTIVGTASDLENQLQREGADSANMVQSGEIMRFSGSGFRDFTRIAASDPVMWRDVFLNNRDAVLEMLGRFSEDLSALQRAIRWEDGSALQDLFTRTRAVRRRVLNEPARAPQADWPGEENPKSVGQPPSDTDGARP